MSLPKALASMYYVLQVKMLLYILRRRNNRTDYRNSIELNEDIEQPTISFLVPANDRH